MQRQAGDGIARRDGEPVVAAIRRERRGDEVDHLPERERDHDEIDAFGAQTDDAGQPRKQHGPGDRDRQRDKRIADAVRGENADGIGAEPDEAGMAEGNQPAVTDQHIERDRGDRKHHDAGAEIDRDIAARPAPRRPAAAPAPGKSPPAEASRRAAGSAGLAAAAASAVAISGLAPETARTAARRARSPSAGRSAWRPAPVRPCGPATAP